jgi:adenine-specific DNA-methyltransferase
VAKKLIGFGVARNEIHNSLLGIEIDPVEAAMARTNLAEIGIAHTDRIVKTSEFFEYCKLNLMHKSCFRAVVGNPPFLRYHDFPDRTKDIAFELMSDAGLKPTGNSNSWVPFLVVSSLLLSENGLLAMIVPAQLFQVSYAAEARRFLSSYYKKLTIITFEKLVFEGIQQDIVVLLGERNGSENEGIRVVEYKDISDLELNGARIGEIWNDNNKLKPLDHSKDKWTQYFLDVNEIYLLRKLREKFQHRTCKEIMGVDIGVVTGRNDYFVLSDDAVREKGLVPQSTRIVCNSSRLRGTLFSETDLSAIKSQSPSWLFTPPDFPLSELPETVQKYIEYGQTAGVSEGFKCRIRKKWYVVTSTWVPDAFLLRQVHEYPKIVLNETNATCTDTIHRVRLVCKNTGKKIVSAFLNSMTLAFSEILGRSYGGGVLTLEPSEVEQLPMPIDNYDCLDVKRIDQLEREHKIEDILDMTDSILLERGLEMEDTEIAMLRNIWRKLRNRRLHRKER